MTAHLNYLTSTEGWARSGTEVHFNTDFFQDSVIMFHVSEKNALLLIISAPPLSSYLSMPLAWLSLWSSASCRGRILLPISEIINFFISCMIYLLFSIPSQGWFQCISLYLSITREKPSSYFLFCTAT